MIKIQKENIVEGNQNKIVQGSEIEKQEDFSNLPQITPAMVNLTNVSKLFTDTDLTKKIASVSSVISSNLTFDNTLLQFAQQINETINSGILKIAQTAISQIASAMNPFYNWINSFDFTPLIETSKNFNKFHKIFLDVMYESRWFPYVGWNVDISIMGELNEIINTSNGNSKRREQRIDKVVFSYYNNQEIRNIKRSWNKTNLQPYIKKILRQALDAHIRGEYVLTIATLSTLWEGLIQIKENIYHERRSSTKNNESFKTLVEKNGFEEIYNSFYENLIISQCNTPQDVIKGVPNRNGVSHSKYNGYPNKKASLNAILLTDFIIHLKPQVK